MASLGLIAYITIGATATMLFKDLDIERDQVKLALKWLAFPALFVLFCVQQVAFGRMPFWAAPPEPQMQKMSAVLNNSMEQLVMHIVCQLSLAATLPS